MIVNQKEQLRNQLRETASRLYSSDLSDITEKQMYKVVCASVMDQLAKMRQKYRKSNHISQHKQVYYMSMEFLVGSSLKNHLYNLGMEKDMRDLLAYAGFDLDRLYAMDPDAGLGNGGLGRLAACYLDSLTGQNLPATGFSIRYEFGIFKQKIIDGWQMEFPDNWLENGEVWLRPRTDEAYEVRLGGCVREWEDNGQFRVAHTDYQSITAVPYDMYVSGYGAQAVNKLVLWSATLSSYNVSAFSRGEYVRALEQNTMAEVISKVLYPADNHVEGKRLRLQQQYLLVSASLQSILARHMKGHGTLDNLSDYVAVHINDTHPALCVPELMRLLMDEYGYGWEDAWHISQETLSYTNHTIMEEALERWSEWLFEEQLPRIYSITKEINRRLVEQLRARYAEDEKKIKYMSVIHDGQIHMANLCLACCHSINGVSKLHTAILKESIFRDYYQLSPTRFHNVTNGIAYRRWLCQANPALTRLLTKKIGTDFLHDALGLERLLDYKNNGEMLEDLSRIKHQNKLRLASYIAKHNGIGVDVSSIFDAQIKRLHEYKRQLLNVLQILFMYQQIKENPNRDFVPRTFLFGAKASAGYDLAKQIIRLICSVSDFINGDPCVRDKIKVVFMEDYRVSLAELIIPAAEISQQISVAGKEASGTGNMKMMINGAVTLGTMDGANVEIYEQVGSENMFLFGLRTEQVNDLWRSGYDPRAYLAANAQLDEVLNMLISGELGQCFPDLYDSLLTTRFGVADRYMIIADFSDYARAQHEVGEVYRDSKRFMRMSLCNIAKAGVFSADRAVREYAKEIWKLYDAHSV